MTCRLCAGSVPAFRAQLDGVEVAYDDIPIDLDWCTPLQRELAACAAGRQLGRDRRRTASSPSGPGGPRAARAAGTFCAQNQFSLVVPCHRVVAADGIGGYGPRRGAEASPARARGSRALSDGPSSRPPAPSSPPSRRPPAVIGSRRPRRSSTRPARCTCAVAAARLPPRRRPRTARRAFALLRALRVESEIRTYQRPPSAARPATSSCLGDEHAVAVAEAGVVDSEGAPLERPPGHVVARPCCRAAYLRGVFLGAGR